MTAGGALFFLGYGVVFGALAGYAIGRRAWRRADAAERARALREMLRDWMDGAHSE